jgi:hypothetical protein
MAFAIYMRDWFARGWNEIKYTQGRRPGRAQILATVTEELQFGVYVPFSSARPAANDCLQAYRGVSSHSGVGSRGRRGNCSLIDLHQQQMAYSCAKLLLTAHLAIF